jgi:hypothetical protein
VLPVLHEDGRSSKYKKNMSFKEASGKVIEVMGSKTIERAWKYIHTEKTNNKFIRKFELKEEILENKNSELLKQIEDNTKKIKEIEELGYTRYLTMTTNDISDEINKIREDSSISEKEKTLEINKINKMGSLPDFEKKNKIAEIKNMLSKLGSDKIPDGSAIMNSAEKNRTSIYNFIKREFNGMNTGKYDSSGGEYKPEYIGGMKAADEYCNKFFSINSLYTDGVVPSDISFDEEKNKRIVPFRLTRLLSVDEDNLEGIIDKKDEKYHDPYYDPYDDKEEIKDYSYSSKANEALKFFREYKPKPVEKEEAEITETEIINEETLDKKALDKISLCKIGEGDNQVQYFVKLASTKSLY